MKVIAIIPARYASTRFPGKPLVDIKGKPMIQHVFEKAMHSGLFEKVIVATDDDRIKNTVLAFGGEVSMTSSNHQSGTDRCGEVVNSLLDTYDVVINIQGDEPFIDKSQLEVNWEEHLNKFFKEKQDENKVDIYSNIDEMLNSTLDEEEKDT